jgi:hypothetical protein
VQPIRCYAAATLLIIFGAATSTVARAQLDADSQREIGALLDFVGRSDCTFVRNGKSYGAAEAESHLEDKLHYLLRMNKVNSAEEFIERAGSESSITGKPYLVNCHGDVRPTAQWLEEELRQLRRSRP